MLAYGVMSVSPGSVRSRMTCASSTTGTYSPPLYALRNGVARCSAASLPMWPTFGNTTISTPAAT